MKRIVSWILILFMILPLAGCADGSAEQVTVAVTFYPLYILAENVLKDIGQVRLVSMTPPATGCLHDYQLLPRDMRTLAGASMLLINGAGMESFLPDVENQFKNLVVVDCSRGVELLAGDEHGEEEHASAHDHGEFNSHIWLDPKNAVQMVRNMSSALQSLLPEEAAKINANAEQYIGVLTALDEELRAAIDALPRKTIVTFHEAFPYFARAYSLEVAAVVALEPDEAPSPRMLSDVISQVKAAGNPPLFTEPQYESDALIAVARETGAPVYELDPLVTGDGAMTAYQDVMRKNLTVLQEALGE